MTEITNSLQVRIVELAQFYYISFHALGTQPETEAIDMMKSWAKEHGLLDDITSLNVFGFNNPDPIEGNEEYGYEVWLVIDPTEISDDSVEVQRFNGGKYAVTTTKIFPLNVDGVIPAWPGLVTWAQQHSYKMGTHQWLEKMLTPFAEENEAFLELYLPIE